jgi:hypothetical protein
MKPSSAAEVVAGERANNKYAIQFTGGLFGGSSFFAGFCANRKDGGL